MSLEVVLQWVGPIGILLVVGTIAATRGWHSERIPNWSFAAERFRVDFPEHEAIFGTLSTDGRVALLELTKGPDRAIGVVVVTGDKWTTRLLSPLRNHLEPWPSGLKLTMNDFTMPTTRIELEPHTANRWSTMFSQLKETSCGSIA